MLKMETEEVFKSCTPEVLEILAVIGHACEGAASVSLAKHKVLNELVAVKKVNLDECHFDFSLIQHEFLMHKQLSHPNIMPCHSTFVHLNNVWSVMPLMAFGSCRDLIQAHFQDGLPELAIAFILREVLQGLEYVHHRALVHRDIRASHILISSAGQVCLTGLRHSHSMIREGIRARVTHNFPNNYNNSLLWASPELLHQNLLGYNTKSDIYSLGITACELANGITPFSDMPITQMLLEKLDGMTPRLMDVNTIPELENAEGLNPEQPEVTRNFSPQFHQFVQICFTINFKDRPTASMLLRHPFFQQVKKKSCQECLPGLLYPVSPITEDAKLRLDPDETEEMIGKLNELTTSDSQWSF